MEDNKECIFKSSCDSDPMKMHTCQCINDEAQEKSLGLHMVELTEIEIVVLRSALLKMMYVRDLSVIPRITDKDYIMAKSLYNKVKDMGDTKRTIVFRPTLSKDL